MANQAEITFSYGHSDFIEALKNGKTLSFELDDHTVRYVPERTCERGEEFFECTNCNLHGLADWWNHCPNCGAKVVGHETRNMSDKEKTCEGCAIPNRDYGHAPSPCNFCARNDEERYDIYTPAKVVE